ncbi:MAG: hypothetical protein ACF8K1_04025 [Phycisphaerales bacterium JB047]
MLVPRFTRERCIILTDADVESLLACAMAAEQQALSTSEPSNLIPAWWGTTDEDLDLLISAIDPAVTQQATIFALSIDPQRALYPPENEPISENELGQLQTRLLTEAAYLALSTGLKRVVWPIRINDNHPDRIGAIGNAIDRAMLVGRTVSLDATPDTAPEVRIDTPFVDLTTEQVTELARDMALPIETCWWNSPNHTPISDQRRARWASIDRRTATQLEPKPGTQAPA